MIEVYRIEHPETKTGPFQTYDNYCQYLARRAGRQWYLKRPEDDFMIIWIPRNQQFGSFSIATLKEWFFLGYSIDENFKIVQLLKKRGFKLAEFLVEGKRLKLGRQGNQVMFDSLDARHEGLVQYHELDKLLQESPFMFTPRH